MMASLPLRTAMPERIHPRARIHVPAVMLIPESYLC
jgi:hypothetical protein